MSGLLTSIAGARSGRSPTRWYARMARTVPLRHMTPMRQIFVGIFVASFVDKVRDNARDKAWGVGDSPPWDSD